MKISITIIIIFTFAFFTESYPQTSKINWDKRLGWTTFGGVIESSDKNYVIGGNSISAPYEHFIKKIDKNGNDIWIKSFEPESTYGTSIKVIKETTEHGFIIGGNIKPGNNWLSSNMYIMKADENGNKLWSKSFPSTLFSRLADVVEVNNNFIIIGHTGVSDTSDRDIVVYMLDSSGNTVWGKKFQNDNSEIASSAVIVENELYVLGSIKDKNKSDSDIYLLKMNLQGDTLLTRRYGGSSSEAGVSIKSFNDTLFITANKSLSAEDVNQFVLKTDKRGDILWEREIGSSEADVAFTSTVDNSGSLLIGGSTNSSLSGDDLNYYLNKLANNGDVVLSLQDNPYANERTPGTSYLKFYITSMLVDSDNNYLLSCVYSYNIGGIGATQAVLLKINSQLTLFNDNKIPVDNYYLSQNYPNPFNPNTQIRYNIAKSDYVKIKIYDQTGRETAVLVNEFKPAGSYEISFDAKNLSSGLYFYKLTAGSYTEMKKMIFLK